MAPRGLELEAAALRRVRVTGLVALLLMGLLLALWRSSDGGPLATTVFDAYQRLMPRPVDRHPAIILAIDEASLETLGPWPWPRHVLAALQEAAVREGARAVAYDLMLSEPDRYSRERLEQIYAGADAELDAVLARLPDLDAYLADSIARLPVVLGRVGTQGEDPAGGADRPLAQAAVFQGPVDHLPHFPRALTNLPELEDYASGHGLLNAVPDADGRIRRVLLAGRIGRQPVASLPLALLRVAQGEEEFHLSASGRQLQLGKLRIPMNPDGTLRPWFSGSLPARFISAADLLGGRLPAGALQGKLALVGVAAIALGDAVTTPLGTSYGVEVHAQVVETVLAGTWLQRPLSMQLLEWALLLALGLAALACLPRLPLLPGIGFLLAALAALAGAGLLLFAGPRLLFDPSLPGLALLGCAIPQYAVLWLEASRQSALVEARRRQVAGELHETRIAHARLDGELSVARDIQLGMLPDVSAIEGLPERVSVSASLEPAYEIGGDLYDLVMLGERQLFFMLGDVTGKGVPAALFMAIAKSLISSAVAHEPGALAQAVSKANRQLCSQSHSAQFLTLIAGLLDCESGEFQLVNAGHQDPVCLGGQDGLRPVICHGGPPLGFVADFSYPLETGRLQAGEKMLLMTDGLCEAQDPQGNLLGSEKLWELLKGLPADAHGKPLLDRLRDAARDHEAGQEPTDDLALLLIEFA